MDKLFKIIPACSIISGICYSIKLQDLIAELRLEVEQLKTENSLLKASSEEHRELNGGLRQELKRLETLKQDLNRYRRGVDD